MLGSGGDDEDAALLKLGDGLEMGIAGVECSRF